MSQPTLADLCASLRDDLGAAGDNPKELVEAGLAMQRLTCEGSLVAKARFALRAAGLLEDDSEERQGAPTLLQRAGGRVGRGYAPGAPAADEDVDAPMPPVEDESNAESIVVRGVSGTVVRGTGGFVEVGVDLREVSESVVQRADESVRSVVQRAAGSVRVKSGSS